jgi:PAS domain-containing protein
MSLSERQIQDRLGSALHRLSALERSVDGGEPKRSHDRMLSEMRRINGDLERAFVEVQDAAATHQSLRSLAEGAERRARLLFMLSPTPCLILDRAGTVLDANPPAVRLVNTSLRHLAGRAFHVFVASERQRFLAQLAALETGDVAVRWPVTIRPRERGSRRVVFAAVTDSDDRLLVMLLPPDVQDSLDGADVAEDRRLAEPDISTAALD